MLAIEFVRDQESKSPVPVEFVGRVTQETLLRGLITIRAGLYSNCLRFLPPLNLTDEQIDEGMAIVAQAVRIASQAAG